MASVTEFPTPPAKFDVAPTMSSREIAELVEKRHDNVKRTIETLVERKVIQSPQIEEIPTATKPAVEYRVGKRDSFVIVAQLSPEFTARVVDRWQELETAVPALPRTYAAALRELAGSVEVIEQQQAKILQMQPKADALDRLANSEGMILISDGAKALQMQIKDLFAWLMRNSWVFRRHGSKRYVGFADKLKAGWIVHKLHHVTMPDGTEVQKEQVFLTPKGLARLAVIFGREVKL